MKYGETTELEITSVDKKGRGCGQIGERKACAYFAFPGEKIEAEMFGRQKGAYKMDVKRIISPSPHRIDPVCAHAGQCGGCKWQQIDYEYQLELKKGLVKKALKPVGLDNLLGDIIPCAELFYFRNRMDYCVSWRGEVVLKAPGPWNSYIDLNDCRLLSEETPEIIKRFRDWIKESGIEPWDNKFYRGQLRYLIIREGKNTDQRLIMILTAGKELPKEKELIESLKPFATTIYHGINPSQSDLSVAEDLRLLHGKPELEEEVNGKRFIIPVNSFFQTNTLMAGKLAETVDDFLSDKPIKTLLDLYCGVGFFGISLANRTEKVIGIELDEQAIAVASRNAKLNNVTNASFTAAKAESLIWKDEQPDAVIIDPPRAGLHPKIIKTLLEKKPERIVYVSCNYLSFAREWPLLIEEYECKKLTALDLFPHTPHVEIVTLLERK